MHYWNEHRQRIYNWMVANNLESYAHTYKGAVVNLHEKTSGYVRFVAHACRDMTNGMAAHKLGRERSQVQYVELVTSLEKQWTSEGLHKGSETLTPPATYGVSTSDETVTISQKITVQIQDLFRQHEAGRQRSDESPYLFFEAFLPNPDDRIAVSQAHLELWKKLQKWFKAHCHENGKIPDKDVIDQIEKKFNQLEMIFLSVADRYTNTIKNVDEVLDKANS